MAHETGHQKRLGFRSGPGGPTDLWRRQRHGIPSLLLKFRCQRYGPPPLQDDPTQWLQVVYDDLNSVRAHLLGQLSDITPPQCEIRPCTQESGGLQEVRPCRPRQVLALMGDFFCYECCTAWPSKA